MTREEAINVLNDYDINFERNTAEEVAEAHEMAIEALQPQPKERTETHECDCISRKDIGLTNLEILMCNGDYKEALKMLLDKIEKAPSVNPQQKTGHWIKHKHNGKPYFKCSECLYFAPIEYSYCPGCGSYNGGTK